MNNAPLPWFEGMPPHRKLVVSQRAEEYTRPVLVAIDYPDQEEVSSKHRQTEDSSSFLLLIRQWHTCFRNLSEPLSNKVARQVDLLERVPASCEETSTKWSSVDAPYSRAGILLA